MNEYSVLDNNELVEVYNELLAELTEYKRKDTLGGEYFEDMLYTQDELELVKSEMLSHGL